MRCLRYAFQKIGILSALLLLLLCGAQAAGAEQTGFLPVPFFQDGAFSGAVSIPGAQAALADSEPSLTECISNALRADAENSAIDSPSVIPVSRFGLYASNRDDIDLLLNAVQCAVNDNAELFYVKTGVSYSYDNAGLITAISPQYDTELFQCRDEFQARMEEILSLVDRSAPQIRQVLFLHDYLVRHVAYDWEVSRQLARTQQYWKDFSRLKPQHPELEPAPPEFDGPSHPYTAYGALVEGEAVCQGYTFAFSALLHRLGIPSVPVTYPGHIWNLIQLDGKWYHIDVTHDDPAPDISQSVSYSRFLVTHEEIETLHQNETAFPAGTTAADYPTDDTFQSEQWIFRTPNCQLQFTKDAIYQIPFTFGPGSLLRYTDLQGPGTVVSTDLGWLDYNVTTNVLLDNALYYFTSEDYQNYALNRLDLNTLQKEAVDTVSYTGQPSADVRPTSELDPKTLETVPGEETTVLYADGRDRLCLIYNPETGFLEYWSATNPRVTRPGGPQGQPLGSHQVRFDNALRGPAPDGEGVCFTLSCSAEDLAETTVLAAFYEGGRLLEIRPVPVEKAGIRTVRLRAESPAWDSFRVFMTGKAQKPLCAAAGLEKAS